MKLSYLKYLCAYLVPVMALFSIYMGGVFSYSAIIFVFGFVPFVELFTSVDTSNMDEVEEAIARDDRFYDYLLYLLVPFQFLTIAYFLFRVNSPNLELYEIIGMITALGMSCGLSINNAHELGHRNTQFEQFLSKLLLMSTLYMHFFIEHNRGHHLRVATEEDPASSRYGEVIYLFYFRTIYHSWMSAWELEQKRLQKAGKSVLSLDNEMLVFQIIQIALVSTIGIVFGLKILLYFVAAAFIGILMLETVNYIEHYGLQRKKVGKRYERTLPIHSWNSSHPFGRMIMLELSRHSDHHYIANRKYQVLRHFENSPQMPTGYPGMMLLALIPPIWFRVMHKQIDKYRAAFDER